MCLLLSPYTTYQELGVSCFSHIFPEDDPNYHFEVFVIHKATAIQQIRDLITGNQFDIFFNLCSGVWDGDTAGKEVVDALELLNVPYAGPTPGFYEPSKEVMKMVAT